LLSGQISVDAYADEQAAAERASYDAMILSIAASPGRGAFLNSVAATARSQHRCTGHFVMAEAAIATDRSSDAAASLAAATATEHASMLEYHLALAERTRFG
jgi:hypothetical protein